jgi:hypothetical protein
MADVRREQSLLDDLLCDWKVILTCYQNEAGNLAKTLTQVNKPD